MAARVLSGLRPAATRPVGLGWRLRTAPAMAAAGLMVIVAAAGYYLQGHFFDSGKMAELRLEEQLPLQDVEVVKQLDFLKHLDTIEKLVQVVDLEPAPEGLPKVEDNPHALEVRRHGAEIA
jgi:hypothetical protein